MELILFYIAAVIAIVSTLFVVTRYNASHALIYLVVSLLAAAVMFFLLGAPFAAILEVIVYAGAIVVLFLFVVMMLNLGRHSIEREQRWFQPRVWVIPGAMVFVLLVLMIYAITRADGVETQATVVGAKAVGISLFSQYLIAVELAGFLLLAGLVGAYHLGRRYLEERREEDS